MANSTLNTLDDQFGPLLGQDFDFTQLFEGTILSILPSALFLCAFPFRLAWLWHKPRTVSGSILHSNKLIIISIFLALQFACLGFWASPSTPRTSVSLVSAALTVADAIALGVLSHLDHLRSVRPSALINVYVLFSLPFDIARARTLWIRNEPTYLAAAFSSTILVKVLILIAEAFGKRGILLAPYQGYPPETISGIYSRSFFWWLNPLLRDGFRKILTNEDLYPIDRDMRSEAVQLALKYGWAQEQNKNRKNVLLFRLFWVIRGPLAKAIFPRLCVTAFQFVQPLLLTAVVNFIQASPAEQPNNIGWALTAAYGLDYVGLAVANGAFYHQTFRMVTITRGTIISLIYSQTVDLSLTSVDESAALTLMSTDVERICVALETIHNLWAAFIEIGLSVFLLQRNIGLAAFGPAALCIFSAITIILLAQRFATNAQIVWVNAIQTRVSATTAVLSGMKAVKMLGLTERMKSLIQRLRTDEVGVSNRFRMLSIIRSLLGMVARIFGPGLTFAAIATISNATGAPFNVANAYSSLNVVALMTRPVNNVIEAIPNSIAAIGCVNRIQDFLNLPAQKDHRVKSSSNRQPAEESRAGDIELEHIITRPASSLTMIKVEHASFAWTEDRPVVNDVSFDVTKGSFTFIVGPVGSGKSTLLKGMIGETPSRKGFVYVQNFKAAFVDQNSWIQNGTLQNNVLAMSSYNRDWYQEVIHACGLQEDISNLPQGDQTRVGSSGIGLSGGQKQRLALARAIYSREQLVILDDCFSGLDATTENKIFIRLLGENGIARKNGITVLFVTHAVHRLSFADNIIVMSSEGTIEEQGTFNYLLHSGDYVKTVIGDHETKEPVAEMNDPPVDIHMELVTNATDINRAAGELTRQVGDLSTYGYYFKATGILNSGMFVVFILLFACFTKLPAWLASYGCNHVSTTPVKYSIDLWVTFWADAVQARGNSVNEFYLGVFILFDALAVIFLAAVLFLIEKRMVPRSSRKLHQITLDTIMAAPLLFFTTTDLGESINRFSQDMSLIDMELPQAFVQLSVSSAIIIISALLICLSASYFAAILPAVLFIMYLLQMFYLRTSRQLRLLDLEAKSPLYSHFVETLEGLVTIRAFGWTEEFEDKNLRLLDASQKPFYLLFCVQRWLGLVLDLTVAGLSVVLMLLVVKLRNTVNPGFVGLALLNVNDFNVSLIEVLKNWTLLETSMGAISRTKSFAADTANENLPDEKEEIPQNLQWPYNGSISMTNLEAAYKPGEPVLKGITLNVRGGQRIGLCGGSGSGKSSIIAALFRMLEIASGSIEIDGLDISTLSRQEVRSHINAIPQEPFFFKGSVRTNLDPAGQHSDEELTQALERVRLLPLIEGRGGLSVACDVEMFSHGQRQLFCLARALLHPSRIIVLDEFTSSVDPAMDKLMQTIIREQFPHHTIIAVAHRLDTVLDFDRIAVLKAGQLIEFGEPTSLLGYESAFKALYDSR